MGWASNALWMDLSSAGIKLNVPHTSRRSARNYTKEKEMSNRFHEVPECGDLVRVCDNRHIIGHTDKAIKVRIGQTLYGQPITTFYPKSMCQMRPRADGGYDIYVPKWINRDRRCVVGEFTVNTPDGFADLPF